MKIAVLTATRDRLAMTQHCFATLHENAGCEFDHYVIDQGSTDGTPAWLGAYARANIDVAGPILLSENIGISAGMNWLLDRIVDLDYDVIVKFDNDCEVTTANALADIAFLTHTYGLLLSPEIHGLRTTPRTLGNPLSLGGQLVDEKHQIGGIFLAAPASLYDKFRYSEANPRWGGDDVQICAYWRGQGGQCGYVQDIHANHYLTTDGQAENDPKYFKRKLAEMTVSTGYIPGVTP